MVKLVCPRCRASFIDELVKKIYGPCPKCGFVINRRMSERKVSERTKKEITITLELEDKAHIAEIVDISKEGTRIIIHNPPFVKKGEHIRSNFGNNGEMKKARVVWTKEESKIKQRAGLFFI